MVEVFFATNRNPVAKAKGHFGERFHADGPMFFRVGAADLRKVSDDPDDGYAIGSVRVFEESVSVRRGAVREVLGSSRLFADLRAMMLKDKRDIIVLIHGFACTFPESLRRAAQIKQAYLIAPPGGGAAHEPHVVVFSWPSNGRVQPPWEYHDDRQDAAASGVAMARFMRRFTDFLARSEGRCEQKIHLVAHSMGNWGLRHSVQNLAAIFDRARLPTIFANVFLMAADEDEDAFEHEHKMSRLTELARSIHVYHSRGDLALLVSDTTKFNPDRLGSDGPRTFSGLGNRIVAIDCHGVDSTGVLAHANHQYYRLRPEVIADVCGVLSGRFPPDRVPGRLIVEPGRRYRLEAEGDQ